MYNMSVSSVRIKIFFIHAGFLQLRRPLCDALIKLLGSKLNVKHEFILDYDPDAINMQEVSSLVSLTKSGNNELFDNAVRSIHVKQLSNALKHMTAIKKAVEQAGEFDRFIILEDDTIFGDDVAQRLKPLLEEPMNCDIMYMGLPSLTPIIEGKTELRNVCDVFKVIPACDSYMITGESAKKLLDKFTPIRWSAHLQFSYIMDTFKENFKALMVVPNIFMDGSKYGVYISTLEPNNRLFLNHEYNKLNSLVRKDAYTDSDEREMQHLFSTMRFPNHPDILLLQAVFHTKRKDYTKAKEVHESIELICQQNGSIVNNESESLVAHMSLYRFLQ